MFSNFINMGSDADKRSATFWIRMGAFGPGSLSYESVDLEGYYLKFLNGGIYVQSGANAQNAVWGYAEPGSINMFFNGGVAEFSSKNYPAKSWGV
jgi:hypothetical protein